MTRTVTRNDFCLVLAIAAVLPLLWLVALIVGVGPANFVVGCFALVGIAALVAALAITARGFTRWLTRDAIRQHRAIRHWCNRQGCRFDDWLDSRTPDHAVYHAGLAALSLGRAVAIPAALLCRLANRCIAAAAWGIGRAAGIAWRSGAVLFASVALTVIAAGSLLLGVGWLAACHPAASLLALQIMLVAGIVAISAALIVAHAGRTLIAVRFGCFAAAVIVCEVVYEMLASRRDRRAAKAPATSTPRTAAASDYTPTPVGDDLGYVRIALDVLHSSGPGRTYLAQINIPAEVVPARTAVRPSTALRRRFAAAA